MSSTRADEVERRRNARLAIASRIRFAACATDESSQSSASAPTSTRANVGCLAAVGLWAINTLRQLVGGRAPAPRKSAAIPTMEVVTELASEAANGTTPVQAQAKTAAAVAMEAPSGVKGLSMRLFGRPLARGSSTPASRLMSAHQSIAARTDDLERRVAEARAQAMALQKSGQRAAALRALRRSKQLEAQAGNLTAASTAIQRQADMLEEAGLQQEVAKALEAGVKENKKVKSAFNRIEAVTDDAHEMCDDVDEVHNMLAQLGSASNDASLPDEDDLLEELQQMVASDEPAPPVAAATPVEHTPTTEVGSSIDKYPAVPTTDAREPSRQAKDSNDKTGLLAAMSR